MKAYDTPNRPELNEIIDQKIASLIAECENADWRTEDVVLAIEANIKTRWLDKIEALRKARAATPDNFISDGNEG